MMPKNATLQNSVLLVIDVINSCAHEDYERPDWGIRYAAVRQMVPRLTSFIRSFQQIGGSVLLMTTVPWREQYLPDNINELYRENEKARYWSTDMTGKAEQFFQIPIEGAMMFRKNSYDAFTCEDLVQALEDRGTQYVIVAGIFGDGCVHASICGGFSRGYHFIIAADLIETTDFKDRQELLAHLKKTTWPMMYGATVDSDEILTCLKKQTYDLNNGWFYLLSNR